MLNRTFSVTITEEEEDKLREEASRCKVLREACAFDRKVGIMLSIELHHLGIRSDSFGGSFVSDRLEELKEFCKKNPWCHIVSDIRGTHYNRVIDHADLFKLADGDTDPKLQYPKNRNKIMK